MHSTAGTLTVDAAIATGGGDVTLWAQGGLTVNLLDAGVGNVSLSAAGTVAQDAGTVITATSLSAVSQGGSILTGANRVSVFSATNTGTGDIVLTNTLGLDVGHGGQPWSRW